MKGLDQKKKRAYIAGKVSGLNFEGVIKKFKAKAVELYNNDYTVVNPVARLLTLNFSRMRMDEEPLTEAANRKEIMGICLYDLSQCDELHLLHDWQESRGAQMEYDFACQNGIKIIYP